MNQAAQTYGWKETSNKEGFIVVFMNGTSKFPNQNLATWNAGTCCDYARDRDIDDVQYTREVHALVTQEFNIKTASTFATGFSNGGMMIHRLACEAPELFTKVVAVAGTNNTLSCTPQSDLEIMHIHALDDTHELFYGGAGKDAFRDLTKVSDFVSVPDSTNFWVNEYNLSPIPSRIYERDGAYCDRYTGNTSASYTLCVTPDGKHSWPGADTPSNSDATPSETLDGNEVIWDFFMGEF
jgi:polyhydroxybutyrate depolymerase